MARRYYIRRRSGPYDAETLREMIRGGLLEEGDELSPDGEGWVPVATALALGPVAGAERAAPGALGPLPPGAAAPAGGGSARSDEEPTLERERPPAIGAAVSGGATPPPLPVPGDERRADRRDGEGEEPDEDDEDDEEDDEQEDDEDDAGGEDDDDDEEDEDEVLAQKPSGRSGREDTLRGRPGRRGDLPSHEYTPIGPLAGRPTSGTLPGFGILPPATPIGHDAPGRPPTVIVEPAGAAEPRERTPSSLSLPRPAAAGSRPGAESGEWSQRDISRFFAGGEAAPPSARSEEDSLGDFDSGTAKAGRRFGAGGVVLLVLLVGGLGAGGWFLWQRTRTPPRASEVLAARRGAGSGSPESRPAADGEKHLAGETNSAVGETKRDEPAETRPGSAAAGSAESAPAPAAATRGRAADEAAEAKPGEAKKPVGTASASGPAAGAGAAAPPPEYAELVAKGDKQLKAGAFGAAAKTFKAALALYPGGAAAHAGLGAASIENGATAAAEAAAKKAIEIDPALASPYRTLGLVFHERGKKAEACANYALFLAKAGTGPLAAEAKENMRDLGCK